MMDADKYQELAMRTANFDAYDSYLDPLMNSALGLCGESGEIADIVKKARFQGHDLEAEREHIIKELGDVAWYVALGATAVGVRLSAILEMNVDKLQSRYPNGFDSERSQHRAEGDI